LKNASTQSYMGVADSLGKKFATIWQCIEEGYISKACRQGLLKLLKKCLVLLTEGEKDRACRRPLLNMSEKTPKFGSTRTVMS
jgi:hypothetical protein